MGLLTPVEANWTTAQAFDSLIVLMYQYGVDGGCFWRWTSFVNAEDQYPTLATPVKQRGDLFVYNPIRDTIFRRYTYPSPKISNPQLTGTNFTLSLPTQIGFNYVLEFINSLNEANWTPTQTNSGNDGQMTLTNTGLIGPSRVYRVRVQ